METDDLLCSRNAPGFVCLVGGSFWSVWFFWMNFRSDQPDKRDRPDEPAFVGRAQWKINQPPSLRKWRASLEEWERRPRCFCAPGTRALRRASFDGRSGTDTGGIPRGRSKRAWRKQCKNVLARRPQSKAPHVIAQAHNYPSQILENTSISLL